MTLAQITKTNANSLLNVTNTLMLLNTNVPYVFEATAEENDKCHHLQYIKCILSYSFL